VTISFSRTILRTEEVKTLTHTEACIADRR
jgi:hypothetical protein